MKGNIRKKIISTSFFFFTYICYRDKIILDGDYVNRQEDLTKVFDKRWKANHNDDVKKAILSGMDGHVSKPVSKESLRETITTTILKCSYKK